MSTVSDIRKSQAHEVAVVGAAGFLRNAVMSADTYHSTLDSTLAREELGWNPTVSLDEGVAKMWQWRALL